MRIGGVLTKALGMVGGAWLLVAAPVAAAQVAAPTIETADAALVRDAVEYARHYDIPAAQALADLRAQQASVADTDAIARAFSGRLVGIVVDHRPALAITVVLTGDAPVADRTLQVAGAGIPVTFRTGARATESELVAAITRYQAPIRAALSQPPALGIDVRTGDLVVLTASGDGDREQLRQRFAALTGMPLRVDWAGAPANMMVPGGSRVTGTMDGDPQRYLCTSGFAVGDGTRDAIVTAAHCPDHLSAAGEGGPVDLPFVSQAGWGYQDVQVNASPQPLSPQFFADTGRTLVRAVAGQQARASTRVGDFVCHRGERTGYSCAEVLMTDFAPAGDLCGGACLPTWVAVDGPTCQGGDSGAPVFSGELALGIVKGGTYRADGSCAMYYYMSLDYLPPGWSLLTDRPARDGTDPP